MTTIDTSQMIIIDEVIEPEPTANPVPGTASSQEVQSSDVGMTEPPYTQIPDTQESSQGLS